MDIIYDAIFALIDALGIMGFVFGISSYISIQTLHKRIEELEDKIKRM